MAVAYTMLFLVTAALSWDASAESLHVTNKIVRSEVRADDLGRMVQRHSHAAAGLEFLQQSRANALARQSLALDRQIQSAADELEPGPTRDFLKTLHLCSPCAKMERFGEDNDGGYVMCTDNLDKGLVGAYSYGINGFDGWGMAIAARYKLPLNEYDCTNAKEPKVCQGCEVHFHSNCILNNDGNAEAAADSLRGISGQRAANNEGNANDAAKMTGVSFKTLTQMLKESGNTNAAERSLLWKIDVEGAEWDIFAQEPIENLKKFRQIVVEYHWLNKQSEHPRYLAAVQKIEKAGFAVAHLHGNNCGGGDVQFGEFKIPNVLEVTYTQKPAQGCAANIPYHVPLDMPNNINAQEVDDAVLPSTL